MEDTTSKVGIYISWKWKRKLGPKFCFECRLRGEPQSEMLKSKLNSAKIQD